MKKTIKHTTPRKKRTIKWTDQYVDFYTNKTYPISIIFIERLAEEFTEWAKNNPRALKLSQFYAEKGIPKSSFYSFVNKYPVLKNAIEGAKVLIGNRREIGMITRLYDPKPIMSRMHAYDEDWKADEVWRMELRVKAQEEQKPQVIKLEYAKEYKPEKKKKDYLPEDD